MNNYNRILLFEASRLFYSSNINSRILRITRTTEIELEMNVQRLALTTGYFYSKHPEGLLSAGKYHPSKAGLIAPELSRIPSNGSDKPSDRNLDLSSDICTED